MLKWRRSATALQAVFGRQFAVTGGFPLASEGTFVRGQQADGGTRICLPLGADASTTN